MMNSRCVILIGMTALAGCGGGSDAPTPVARLAIDSSNASQAASVSWKSANDSADMAELAASSGFVATAPDDTLASLSPAPGSLELTTVVNSIPFGPQTLPCQETGSVTISGDLADPLTLTPGDTISVDADNCDDGLGEVVDGLLEFTVDAFTGDFIAGLYALTMSLELTNFQVTAGTDVTTGNGDVTVSLDTTAAPAVSASVSGMSMTTDTNAASTTLTNYLTAQTLDAGISPSPYTFDASGTVDSTELPGEVTYSTPVIFTGFDNDYPGVGELLITGDGSSARLVAIDNVDVRIDIDNDGDGTVDENIFTTWAALDGA